MIHNVRQVIAPQYPPHGHYEWQLLPHRGSLYPSKAMAASSSSSKVWCVHCSSAMMSR